MEGASAGSGGAANGQDREVRIAALRESIERHTVPSHPLAALKPHPRNSRVHPPAQLDEIERSMLEWGWTMPILADEDGTILAGHGRKMVGERLGLDEAPVIFATGWSDAQKRAYIIADNKLPENAEWDPAMLKIEMEELGEIGFDVSLIGFAPDELSALTLPQEPARQPGLGNLAARFGIPPFSVMNAREGWWQDRKRAWIAIGIQSELGRGAAPGGRPRPLSREKMAKANATPGGSNMPAANYSKSNARGVGRGRPVK